MKRLSGFIFLFVVLISSCVNYDVKEKDPAAFTIPSYKAKEDFKLFRTIIEKAHPSLYSYLPKKRIETIFDSIATTIAQGITYREFFNKLYFITNEIGCSHSAVSLPASVNDSLFNRALFFPLPVLKVENKLLVNYTGDRDLPHGTEILKINNAPAAAILDSLMFYNPVEGYKRETQQYMASADFGYEYFMKFGGNKNFTVVVKDSSGKKDTVILKALSYDDLSFRQQNKYYKDATDVDYSLVVDDTLKKATLRLTTFEFESINKQTAFDAFLKNSFELLKKRGDIKNLVIDLRENGGGFLYYCFLLNSYLSSVDFNEYKEVFSRLKFVPYEEYLSPKFGVADLDFVNGKLKEEFERIGNRVQHLKDTSLKTWEPDKLHFTGNTYIITNWHVNSAASYFTHLAKKTANAKVVGTETAGGTHSGNGFRTIKYQLPQTGFEFEFPFAKMIYTNGDKKTGRGMIPDHIVPDTYESFIKNEDRQQVYINDSLLKKQ
jgi:hypothetical protein